MPDPAAIPPAVIVFATPEAAACRIAGLPAVARAVHEAAEAGLRECWLVAGSGWTPPPAIRAEIDRLAGLMRVFCVDAVAPPGAHCCAQIPDGRVLLMSGEALVPAPTLRAAMRKGTSADPALAFALGRDSSARARLPHRGLEELARARRAIMAATTKPGDGLVSRHVNRRISRVISGFLLRFGGVRPIHGTFGTAALGLAMLLTLVLVPGQRGLLAGALLFQAASVFDGVDGEIARATLRCSDRGALIDSLVDAATNLGFVTGIVINLFLQHERTAALFGLAGLLVLALGLTIIGRRARHSGGPFSFDGVKHHVRAGGSRVGLWLTWLTMRDFYALASVVLVLAGLTVPALVVFSGIMAVWLMVVLAVGRGQPA